MVEEGWHEQECNHLGSTIDIGRTGAQCSKRPVSTTAIRTIIFHHPIQHRLANRGRSENRSNKTLSKSKLKEVCHMDVSSHRSTHRDSDHAEDHSTTNRDNSGGDLFSCALGRFDYCMLTLFLLPSVSFPLVPKPHILLTGFSQLLSLRRS